MLQPPVRELLANHLRKHQDTVLQQLMALILEAPDLKSMHELATSREYHQAVTTLLDLLVQNIASPSDKRVFYYARQRAMSRFRQNIQATQMLRIASLHRQVLTKMISHQFAEDPTLVRSMTEIIEAQIGEIEVAFTEAYQGARDKQWSISETKYYALFENASEAIISFLPGEGRIIEVNAQAERLVGKVRGELLQTHLADLFEETHREQVTWLVSQNGGTSNIRLEDLAVRRADGVDVPISLSCNWMGVDGTNVGQIIMRDVTQMRQMQRELQSYAEQLEDRVEERTQELRQSEERFRSLFLQEQSRAQHLALINDVQQCALVTRDVSEFLHQVTLAIHSHFRSSDVSFLLRRSSVNAFLLLGESPSSSNGTEPSSQTSSTRSSATSPLPAPQNIAQQNMLQGRNIALQDISNLDEDALTVAAQIGGHGLSSPLGARVPLLAGTPLQEVMTRGTLHFGNNALLATHSATPGVHRAVGSEILVPVRIEGATIGVLQVRNEASGAYDPRDAVALQTAALIAATHVQSSRMFREMTELKEFNETLVGTMLHSLMVVNGEGEIQLVNERLTQTLGCNRAYLVGQNISEVLGEQTCEKHDLRHWLSEVTRTGAAREVPEVHVALRSGDGRETELIFDVRLSRVYFRGEARVVMLLINLTVRWKQTQQLQLMNEMSRLFQVSLDIDRVLHTVLTCVTAGPALGFNRAFLLLLDDETQILRGVMALGPSSAEEASHIWSEIGQRDLSLQEMLAVETPFDAQHPTPLQQSVMSLRVDLSRAADSPLARAVRERRALCVEREEIVQPLDDEFSNNANLESDAPASSTRSYKALADLLLSPSTAIAPLIAKDRVVGVVLADNLYSSAAIEEDDIRLLETVAQQAGLTIDNALTYQDLQKAQNELVSAERLVAVGEMSARVSHEIRNPLATIGGFARAILRHPEQQENARRKTEVIVEEVERLEELLNDLLDMARPRELDLQLHNVNEIVERALLLAEADIKANKAEIILDLASELPSILVDRRRLLQALLNTLRNGAQAMPDGGEIHVATRIVQRTPTSTRFLEVEIRDSGVGIPQKALKQVFDPFFSTKIRGSGLGLAVTLRIIRDHGGDIDVHSDEGRGTTFVICLPMRLDNAATNENSETTGTST